MKKQILLILLSCILLSLVSGCAGEKHKTSGWDVDLTSHWQTCEECGETVKQGEHDFGKSAGKTFQTCKTCGATVIDWGDGTTVYLSDGSDDNDGAGNPVKSLEYDSNGNLMSTTTHEYERDDNGNVVKSFEYQDGVLRREQIYAITDNGSFVEKDTQISTDSLFTTFYALNNSGESYITSTVFEYSDNTKSDAKQVETYDEMGTVIRCVVYDVDGNVIIDNIYEPTYDESGNLIRLKNSYYNLGWADCDADGNVVNRGTYENTPLQYGFTKEYAYDNEGNQISYWCYDSEGNLRTEETYKHVNEEETYTGEDGTVYTNSSSYSYTDTRITYDWDGTKTVTTYDENYNVLSQITYDANGNEIN